jgi:AcrR family transcriptional regulator
MPAQTLRARVRAEMIEEIKSTARRHLAVEGANLSLRAVARDLGMVSSAVYRYFASRDELLTALILDGYTALGSAAEQAEAAVARADLAGRWLATCRGVRDWARANPHEYALLYGSPVPGYAAPQDTVAPASRVPLLLTAILGGSTASAGCPKRCWRGASPRGSTCSACSASNCSDGWTASSTTPTPTSTTRWACSLGTPASADR